MPFTWVLEEGRGEAKICLFVCLNSLYAAPAVEFANKLAASGSKNAVMILKGSMPNCAVIDHELMTMTCCL